MGDQVWFNFAQRSDLTLAELFDCPGFVDYVKYQSYTTHGAWVKQFLVNHMSELCMRIASVSPGSQLVHLLLDAPDAEASEDVARQFPMLACELLCLEIKELDRVLASPHNLQRLCAFYEPDRRTSNRPLGVTKVLISVLGQKRQRLISHLVRHPSALTHLLDHLEATSDLIPRLLLEMEKELTARPHPKRVHMPDFNPVASLYARFGLQYEASHFVLVQVLMDLAFRSRSFILSSLFEQSNVELLLATILPHSDRAALANPDFVLSNPSGFRYGLALLNHLLAKVGVGCERIPRARLVTVMHEFPASEVTVSPSESASASLSHSMELEVPKSVDVEQNNGEAKEQCDGEKENEQESLAAIPLVVSLPMTRVIFDEDEHFDLQSARALYESHVPLDATDALPAIATLLLQRQTDLLATLGASAFPTSGDRSESVSTTAASSLSSLSSVVSSVNSNGRRSRVASVSGASGRSETQGAPRGRASEKTFGFQRLQVLKCFDHLIDLGMLIDVLIRISLSHWVGFDCIKRALAEQSHHYLTFLKLMFHFQDNDFCEILVAKIYVNTITFLTDKCDDRAITTFLDQTNIMAHLIFHENELKRSTGVRGLNPFLKTIDASLGEYNKRIELVEKAKINALRFESEERERRKELSMGTCNLAIRVTGHGLAMKPDSTRADSSQAESADARRQRKEREIHEEMDAITKRRREREMERERREKEEQERKRALAEKEQMRQAEAERQRLERQQQQQQQSASLYGATSSTTTTTSTATTTQSSQASDSLLASSNRPLRCNSREILMRKEERARLQREREQRERQFKEEEATREAERLRRRAEREERERTGLVVDRPEPVRHGIDRIALSAMPTRVKDREGVDRPVRPARGSDSAATTRRGLKYDSM